MGTRSAKADIKLSLEGLLRNVLGTGKGMAELREKIEKALAFVSGTTANKIDRLWVSKGRSLNVGSETIDVYDFAGEDIGAGAGLDALGQAMALAEIAFVLILNNDADGTLRVGGEGTTAAWNAPFNADDSAVIDVLPGGVLLLVAPGDPGYPVADMSNHLLKIEAVTANIGDWDLIIGGRSA